MRLILVAVLPSERLDDRGGSTEEFFIGVFGTYDSVFSVIIVG
jgi:hypothetical protein